jgi:hypothetical protein
MFIELLLGTLLVLSMVISIAALSPSHRHRHHHHPR